MSLTVAIPTWNNERQLLDTVQSLVLNTDFEGQLLIVNNGESNGLYEWVQHQCPRKLAWLEPGENLGWIGGINAALAEADGDLFCMLNDDVLFPPASSQWWRRLLSWFQHPEIGGVGPSSNYVSGVQSAFMKIQAPVISAPYLIGFCAVYRTAQLREMGGLDPALPGGDDLDLSIRMQDAGRTLLADRRCYLHHHGQQTGKRIDPGWDSLSHQARTYNALIRKHGLKRWWQMLNGESDTLKAVWVDDDTTRVSREAMHAAGNDLKAALAQVKLAPSDICQHADTLYTFASSCRHVTEFGTNDGTSTKALLAARPEVLETYDIVRYPEVSDLSELAKAHDVRFRFHNVSTLEAEISGTDMLFVDDLHTYAQVKAELELHAEKVRKYIAFHDTHLFRWHDEVGTGPGIWKAISEWLRCNPQWQIVHQSDDNNGLVVVAR